jgi:hypothetical protein
MADPAPQGNSDTGLYRIVGRPIVSVVEAEYEGRYVRVGVNNVQVLLDSAAYDIQPNSRVSERENNPQIRTVAGGVQVHASDESESLDGPLWGYGDVLLVQRNGEPDGSMEVSLRAGRRSFRVGEFDEQGREKQVETTTEKTAIIDVILRKDREIDGLGHIVLAKVRWKRSTE